MFNNLNIFEIQPTTVSTNLWEYSTIFLGLTGDGKTYSMNKYLNSVLPPNKKPLWILLEDRSKSVAGLNGVRVHSVPELLQVVAQLQNPQAKEMFGCVVFDTLDKLSDMLDKYIVDAKQVEVLGDLQYGKGNRLLNSKAQVLTEIRNMGYGVHFTCQLYKKEDFIKKTTSYVTTVPSTIKDRVFADAFFIGALKLDKTSKTPVTSDRLITFTKTSELPELKDGIGIGVKEVKIADLKDTLDRMKASGRYTNAELSIMEGYVKSAEKSRFEYIRTHGDNLINPRERQVFEGIQQIDSTAQAYKNAKDGVWENFGTGLGDYKGAAYAAGAEATQFKNSAEYAQAQSNAKRANEKKP